MWTWSISAAGNKKHVLDLLEDHECLKNDDGTDKDEATLASFEKAKAEAVAKVGGLPDDAYVEVGISGNNTIYSPTISVRQVTGQMLVVS